MILTTDDFNTGGRFEGVPSEIAETLLKEVNGKAAQLIDFERQFQAATIEVLPQLAHYDPTVTSTILAGIGSKVLQHFKPENVDGRTFFRDSQGTQQLNERTEPATAGDLFKQFTFSIFKPNGQQAAAPNPGSGNKSQGLDLSGAKDKVEAYALIEKHLESKGIGKSHKDFNSEFTKMREASNTENLPLRKR